MRIDFSGFDILVTELFLHDSDIRTRFQQVRGKGMPQRMTCDLLFDVSAQIRFFEKFVDRRFINVVPPQASARWIERQFRRRK
jgi:hypothetical protein